MSQSKLGAQQIRTTCCIVGGGPAGMMLGLLLARAGVEVIVLEKHGDFLRDFRGDTIHPSTLELLHELGMLDEFLRLPHQEMRRVKIKFDDEEIAGPDFSHMPTRSSRLTGGVQSCASGPGWRSRISACRLTYCGFESRRPQLTPNRRWGGSGTGRCWSRLIAAIITSAAPSFAKARLKRSSVGGWRRSAKRSSASRPFCGAQWASLMIGIRSNFSPCR